MPYHGLHVMALLEQIAERRSIQRFKTRAVGKEKLERILEAGRLAPSAKNRQEWRFVVLQKAALREKVKEAAFGDEKVAQAPVIVALCTTNVDYRMPNGQPSYPIDLGIAAAFMMLQATEEGLGSCCVSTYDEAAVGELISIPFSMRVVLLLLIGYPEKVPEAAPRKALKRVVGYEHW